MSLNSTIKVNIHFKPFKIISASSSTSLPSFQSRNHYLGLKKAGAPAGRRVPVVQRRVPELARQRFHGGLGEDLNPDRKGGHLRENRGLTWVAQHLKGVSKVIAQRGEEYGK